MIKKEETAIVLVRQPPGDNWAPSEQPSRVPFTNLTDALNYVFEQTGCRKFIIDAEQGVVKSIVTVEAEAPAPKKYSIYDE